MIVYSTISKKYNYLKIEYSKSLDFYLIFWDPHNFFKKILKILLLLFNNFSLILNNLCFKCVF
jgi:hypothetical protein